MINTARNPLFNRLLIVACGSIHAAQLPSDLQVLRPKVTENIKVLLTDAAASFVSRLAIDVLTSADPVRHHMDAVEWADGILVLPATANTIGKVACGIADDETSTVLLAWPHGLVVAPAMNATMWQSPAVQRNIKRLQDDGHTIVWPEPSPAVASGDATTGRGPRIEEVVRALRQHRLTQLHTAAIQSGAHRRPVRKTLPLLATTAS